jgi:hypothetical protein
VSAATIERIGRIHFASDATGPRRFVASTLFVPRGWRDRLRVRAGVMRADAVRTVTLGDNGLPEGRAWAPVHAAVHAAADRGAAPGWVQVDDYEHAADDRGSRGRSIVFLFPSAESAVPFAVAKVRRGGEGLSLRHERDALWHMSTTPLRASVPEVRSYEENGATEVLIASAVQGRSMYRTMKSALWPHAHVRGHFAAAAGWLAQFQNGRELGSHGDFWARNILLARGATSVVDWEHFDPDGDPLADVFHFPLTYALAFRWELRERADSVEKFRRAFAVPNVLSSAIREWMSEFGAARGLDRSALRARMLTWLEAGAEGRIARPRLTEGEWSAMADVIRGRAQCVFSG